MTAAVVSSLSASLGLDPASPYCALLEQVFHLTKPGAGLEDSVEDGEIQEEESQEEEEEEEVKKISARMNTFRKEERTPSLFTRAIERLSFR